MKLQAMKSWFARVGSVAVIGTACGAIGGFGGYAALSYAAGQNLGGANDYQIPYQGILELGGEPVDGPTDFVFTLYKSKDSVAPADKLWTSNPRTLQVSRGYFATVLGDESDLDNRLDASILAENVLYVGMNVDGVELAGRQRILAVPYAQNGSPGKNFVVDGRIQTVDLAVTRDATVNGKLNVVGTSTLGGGIVGGLNVAGGTTLNDGTILNDGATVNGTSHLKSDVRMDGNVTAGGTGSLDKLVQTRSYTGTPSKDTGLYISTEFDSDKWNCVVGGFRLKGDINEANYRDPLLAIYATPGSGSAKWRIYVRMEHDGNPPVFEVGLSCFKTTISHRGSGSYF